MRCLGPYGFYAINHFTMFIFPTAVIVAYNVGVERSAARQALNLNVPILKFDLLEDAANAIVDNQFH